MRRLAVLLMLGLVGGGGCAGEKKILDAQGHEIRVWEGRWDNGKTKFEYEYYIGETQDDPVGLGTNIVRVDKHHVLAGYFKAYSEDGKPVVEANFKDGVPDGRFRSFVGGQIRYERNFKDGKEEGRQVDYDPDGNVFYERNYKDGVLHGWWVSFTVNEKLEGNYKDGKQDGRWVQYYKRSVQIHIEASYREGTLDGRQVEYDPSGNVMYEQNYKNGVKQGWSVSLDGREKVEGNYKDGKQDGRWVQYYFQSAQIHFESNYNDGNLDGMWFEYNSRGQISQEWRYDNGKIYRTTLYIYDENGTLRKTFLNGTCTSGC